MNASLLFELADLGFVVCESVPGKATLTIFGFIRIDLKLPKKSLHYSNTRKKQGTAQFFTCKQLQENSPVSVIRLLL